MSDFSLTFPFYDVIIKIQSAKEGVKLIEPTCDILRKITYQKKQHCC